MVGMDKEVQPWPSPSSMTNCGNWSNRSCPRPSRAGPGFPAAQAPEPPPRPHRHPLCPQDRHSLGGPAPGNGLRIGHELLAVSARLAGGRRVGPDPPSRSRPPAGQAQHPIDLSVTVVDSSHVRTVGGGAQIPVPAL